MLTHHPRALNQASHTHCADGEDTPLQTIKIQLQSDYFQIVSKLEKVFNNNLSKAYSFLKSTTMLSMLIVLSMVSPIVQFSSRLTHLIFRIAFHLIAIPLLVIYESSKLMLNIQAVAYLATQMTSLITFMTRKTQAYYLRIKKTSSNFYNRLRGKPSHSDRVASSMEDKDFVEVDTSNYKSPSWYQLLEVKINFEIKVAHFIECLPPMVNIMFNLHKVRNNDEISTVLTVDGKERLNIVTNIPKRAIVDNITGETFINVKPELGP